MYSASIEDKSTMHWQTADHKIRLEYMKKAKPDTLQQDLGSEAQSTSTKAPLVGMWRQNGETLS